MDINNLGERCGSKTIEVKKIKNMVEREEEGRRRRKRGLWGH